MLSRRALLAAPLATTLVGAARAQTSDFPKNPVKFVIPSAPGGPTDVMARMISPGLTAKLGQPVLIINRPGAGGNIGVVQVAKSLADGYTLLIASTGFVVNPSLYREPGYDPFKDFLPITELGSSPNVVLVHPSSNITSIAQLIEMAKKDKNKLNVINPGQGSTPHLTAELLQLKAGIGVENIPYNGAGPAIAALLGKTTQVGITRAAARPCADQVGSAAGDRDHRRAALVRSARRSHLEGIRLSRSGLGNIPGNVCAGRHARRHRAARGARHARRAQGYRGHRQAAGRWLRCTRERAGRPRRAGEEGSADVARRDREVGDGAAIEKR